MSERYDALLADHLTARLGLGWEYRERGPGRNPSYDLAAVPQPLIAGVLPPLRGDRRRDRPAASPTTSPLTGTGPTRPPCCGCASRPTWPPATPSKSGPWPTSPPSGTPAPATPSATTRACGPPACWPPRQPPRSPTPGCRPGPSASHPPTWSGRQPGHAARAGSGGPAPDRRDAAELVLAVLSRKRATWTPWNVDAEASRALKAHRFPTSQARDEATAAVVAAVAARSVLLTPPEVAPTPPGLRRADGSSVFRPHRAERYTCQASLDAEARLLAAGRDTTGPTLGRPALDAAGHAAGSTQLGCTRIRPRPSPRSPTSGRVVDVLVGPAGSGKTRTLAALRRAWEAEHGTGSVVGLAPSAAAADVLAQSLGIGCENTAKWLVEHDQNPTGSPASTAPAGPCTPPATPTPPRPSRHTCTGSSRRCTPWRFRPGQLVILDEASLAGTADLDRIAACAGEAGAKLLLVGDWAQLSAIDAGGAFALLVRDRGPGVPELGAARRFTHEWERAASTRLRVGDAGVIGEYAAHDRLREGEHDAMVEAAYTAWATDTHAGRTSAC